MLTIASLLALLAILEPVGVGLAQTTVLRRSCRGAEVVLLQDYLVHLEYLPPASDGIFGSQTEKAVLRFQEDEGLSPDGVVGKQTWARLRTRRIGSQENTGQRPELVLWSEANNLLPHGAVANLVDVRTGLSFQIRRYYGHYHADVEPLTSSDTQIIKRLYGGCFSWERRAVVVSVGGREIAASMNGFPHGDGAISGNDFDGHFCLHFLGSRLHLDGTIHRSHQEKVLEAAGYGPSELWFDGDRTR